MDPLQTFNAFEAGLWTVLALVLTLAPIRGLTPLLRLQFGASLVLFAVSELMEIQSGAWWRPWWLALWKGLCILLLTGGFMRLYKNRRVPSHPGS